MTQEKATTECDVLSEIGRCIIDSWDDNHIFIFSMKYGKPRMDDYMKRGMIELQFSNNTIVSWSPDGFSLYYGL